MGTCGYGGGSNSSGVAFASGGIVSSDCSINIGGADAYAMAPKKLRKIAKKKERAIAKRKKREKREKALRKAQDKRDKRLRDALEDIALNGKDENARIQAAETLLGFPSRIINNSITNSSFHGLETGVSIKN